MTTATRKAPIRFSSYAGMANSSNKKRISSNANRFSFSYWPLLHALSFPLFVRNRASFRNLIFADEGSRNFKLRKRIYISSYQSSAEGSLSQYDTGAHKRRNMIWRAVAGRTRTKEKRSRRRVRGFEARPLDQTLQWDVAVYTWRNWGTTPETSINFARWHVHTTRPRLPFAWLSVCHAVFENLVKRVMVAAGFVLMR